MQLHFLYLWKVQDSDIRALHQDFQNVVATENTSLIETTNIVNVKWTATNNSEKLKMFASQLSTFVQTFNFLHFVLLELWWKTAFRHFPRWRLQNHFWLVQDIKFQKQKYVSLRKLQQIDWPIIFSKICHVVSGLFEIVGSFRKFTLEVPWARASYYSTTHTKGCFKRKIYVSCGSNLWLTTPAHHFMPCNVKYQKSKKVLRALS